MRGDQLLYKFWSTFSQAVDSNSVDDDQEFPYIAYQCTETEFGQPISLSATVWDNDSSWEWLEQKADEIRQYISRGGRCIMDGDTGIYVTWGTPFKRRTSDPKNKNIKAIIININVEFYVR